MPNRRDYIQRNEGSQLEQRREDSNNVKKRTGAIATDFSIPNSTLKDIDLAVYNYFAKTLNINIKINDVPTEVKTIFASGERWALVRKRIPLRDKDGKLILPLITVRRTDINRTTDFGGLPGDLNELIIKRKISSKNPNYQNLINQVGLRKQKNVAKSGDKKSDAEGTRRNSAGPKVAFSGVLYKGKVVKPESLRPTNIYEIYSIDFPDFFVANYEIVIWTQYMSHGNLINESIFKSFDWKSSIKLDTDKGHYYVAMVEPSVSNQSNDEDFSDRERVVKTSFNIKVNGYIFGDSENEEVSVRKSISAPQVLFEVFDYKPSAELFDKEKWEDPVDKINELKESERKVNRRVRGKGLDSSLPVVKKTKSSAEKVWFVEDVEDLEDFFAT